MKKIESFLWILLLLLILARTTVEVPFIMILISGMILSGFYFYFSLLLLNNIDFKNIFQKQAYREIKTSRIIGSILTGINYATLSIGVTFKALAWPGSLFFIMFSVFTLLIIIIIASYKAKYNQSISFYHELKKRTLLLLVIGSIFAILSSLPIDIQKTIFPSTKNSSLKL